MNEFKLKGKVFNLYEDRGIMYITLRVFHEHTNDGRGEWKESFFRVLVNDTMMFPPIRKIRHNEEIIIKGHMCQEYTMTSGGNKRQFVRFYADEVHTVD